MANEISQIRRIAVRLVLAPWLTDHLEAMDQIRMRHIDKGADDDVAAARNAGEARRPRPLDRVHKKGLRAVARCMRCQNPCSRARRPGLSGQIAYVAEGGGVAHLAGGSL